jgi:hypothetical protein
MPGLGTIINVTAIFAAGIMGMLFGARIPGRLQDSMIICSGIGTIFIAVSGAMEKMLFLSGEGLTSRGSMMLILCLTLGTITGELLQLDERLENFGEWLKKKTGNAGDNSFVHAFVTASLTVSIGAMAIVGSIQDGISLGSFHSDRQVRSGLLHHSDHDCRHGKGRHVLRRTRRAAAGIHDHPFQTDQPGLSGKSRGAFQPVPYGLGPDLLRGRQPGLEAGHPGGLHAAGPCFFGPLGLPSPVKKCRLFADIFFAVYSCGISGSGRIWYNKQVDA